MICVFFTAVCNRKNTDLMCTPKGYPLLEVHIFYVKGVHKRKEPGRVPSSLAIIPNILYNPWAHIITMCSWLFYNQ